LPTVGCGCDGARDDSEFVLVSGGLDWNVGDFGEVGVVGVGDIFIGVWLYNILSINNI
jgi:hypothetical protein